MPTNPFITDGKTFTNPVGLGFTLLMGILVIVLPRRHALLPIIALMCYMTMGMRLMVGGMNFTMIRVLLLFAWVRLLLRSELRQIPLNQIDKAMIWFTVVSVMTYTVLWGTADALKDKLGLGYNLLGFYFFFRFVLRDFDDLERVFKTFALLLTPLAGLMILEKLTGINSFSAFGGVSPVTTVRDGVLRCQGPFAHPILAGTFGATLAPLFVALWCRGNRVLAMLGLVSSVVITLMSGSSGPVLALGCGLVGTAIWRIRRYMRQIRWAILLGLTTLHLVMKAPVWFILARIDIFSGSTGYHRAYLIDRAIAHVSDWWLIGTKSTAAWADVDQGLFDVTSQYLFYAADGGLVTMLLFIAIIVFAFRAVGQFVRGNRKGETGTLMCAWALGAALFAHVMNFLSVSYFDQNIVNWYLLLAMISTAAASRLLAKQTARLPLQSDSALSGAVVSGARAVLEKC